MEVLQVLTYCISDTLRNGGCVSSYDNFPKLQSKYLVEVLGRGQFPTASLHRLVLLQEGHVLHHQAHEEVLQDASRDPHGVLRDEEDQRVGGAFGSGQTRV